MKTATIKKTKEKYKSLVKSKQVRTMWVLSIIVGYFAIGLIIHYVIMPVRLPVYSDYFKPGKLFHSKLEGLTQKVTKLENGKLITTITIEPGAKGPVVHTHEKFDELFTVQEGTLSMQYGVEIKTVKAGQAILIPKNTAHRPFNATDALVVVTNEMPVDFAYCLSQIYPFWDESEANTKPPKILFQLAVFGNRFDSYPTVDAPPKPALKVLKFLLAPTARLLGYKIYKEKYKPQ